MPNIYPLHVFVAAIIIILEVLQIYMKSREQNPRPFIQNLVVIIFAEIILVLCAHRVGNSKFTILACLAAVLFVGLLCVCVNLIARLQIKKTEQKDKTTTDDLNAN